jgi:aerobic-type carbon monoxide dehydrogenase small subunit (CoxS/CutS family)
MPRKSVPAATPTPSNCLICWEIQSSRNIQTPEVFEKLLKVFQVDSSTTNKWDLRDFSFCGNCTTGLKQLLKVYDKLESLKDEVKKKVGLSQGKCFSRDLRINNFRTQILKQRGINNLIES